MGDRTKVRANDDRTLVLDVEEDTEIIRTTNLNDVTQTHSFILNNN